ncbi:MAG: hypothetical protein Q9187_006514 [Circinaria calcarea]
MSPSSPSRILIIGSLNTDLTTLTPRLPRAGETLTATSFRTGCGGKGANQAVACARASRRRPPPPADPRNVSNSSSHDSDDVNVQVSMVGAVGSDTYGTQLLNELSGNGIDVSGISVHENVPTGVAVIIVESSTGENRILVIPGANALVTFDNLVPPLPELVVLQLEIPLQIVLAVMRAARQQGVDVLLNPAPAVELPVEALQGLGHLVMNESEASILSGGVPDSEEADSDMALQSALRKFSDLAVQQTIITLGAEGVAYSTGQGSFARLAAEEVDKVIDTTAAGDTFVGTYAVEVVKWKREQGEGTFDLRKAVGKANRAAARTVQRKGAMESIPWVDEV